MTEATNTTNPGPLAKVIGAVALTMSSREIAELTGSTHDNVLKTIRGLIGRGVISGNETPYTHPQNGQVYVEFRLGYRDTMVVVSGYSVELRAKIIDRWQELEEGRGNSEHQASAAAGLNRVSQVFRSCVEIAEIAKLTGNQAVLSGAGATKRITGIDPLAVIGLTGLQAPEAERLLTATEIGRHLSGVGPAAVNKRLAEIGVQRGERDGRGRIAWEPTEAGMPYAVYLDTAKRHSGGAPVRQVKWKSGIRVLFGADWSQ